MPAEFGQEVGMLPCIVDFRRRFFSFSSIKLCSKIANVVQRRKERLSVVLLQMVRVVSSTSTPKTFRTINSDQKVFMLGKLLE
jgi:hypothetical protein